MAYAGASVDGRNEGQKSLNVDVPEESLGMARLTDCPVPQLANFFSLDSTTSHKSGRHLITLGRETKGWHHSLGRAPTIDGTIVLVVCGAHTLLHASIGDGRPSLYTEGNSEDDARLSARAYTVAGSSGQEWTICTVWMVWTVRTVPLEDCFSNLFGPSS